MVNLLFIQKSTNCDSDHVCLKEDISCDFFRGPQFATESVCVYKRELTGDCTNKSAWPENQRDGEK